MIPKDPAKTSHNVEFFAGMVYSIFTGWWNYRNFTADADEYYPIWTGENVPSESSGEGNDEGGIIDEIIDIIL